jgi:hypothetical protein
MSLFGFFIILGLASACLILMRRVYDVCQYMHELRKRVENLEAVYGQH